MHVHGEVQLTGSNVVEASLFDNVIETTVVEKPITGAAQILINVSQIDRFSITVDGKWVDGTTVNLPVINMSTGNSMGIIIEEGSYVVDCIGYQSVVITAKKSREIANLTCSAKLFLLPQRMQIPKMYDSASVRKIPEPKVTVVSNSYENTIGITPDGQLYGRRDFLLRKSVDSGATWTTVFDFVDKKPVRAMTTKSGRVVVTHETKGLVYTSDATGLNFVQTLDMAPSTNYFHNMFGSHCYGDIVAIAEYNATKTPPTATGAYVSYDAGQTWTKFFNETAAPDGYHLHDIKYDPYEDMFWIAAGDSNATMVYYTKDRGINWHKVADWGKAPLQSTQIIVLPECVLFLSDSPLIAVSRYNRPATGTPAGKKLVFETAMVLADSCAPEGEPIACTHAAKYFDNACAFFGWSMLPGARTASTVLRNSQIYGTVNGREFFVISSTSKPSDGVGVGGVYGPDSTGNFVAAVQDKNLGAGVNSHNHFKFNLDMWKAR